MGKIIVPQPNEQERAVFQKGGISLIESMEEEAFLEVIADYLCRHNVLHLATCKNNEPRCTPLEYFNNGLNVYVCSEGGGKIANIKANPRVAYGISDPYHPAEDFFGASGLQVWGTATVFKRNDDPEGFAEIFKYSRNLAELGEQGLGETASSYNFNLISIAPTKIRYLCYRKGFRNVIWKKDP